MCFGEWVRLLRIEMGGRLADIKSLISYFECQFLVRYIKFFGNVINQSLNL